MQKRQIPSVPYGRRLPETLQTVCTYEIVHLRQQATHCTSIRYFRSKRTSTGRREVRVAPLLDVFYSPRSNRRVCHHATIERARPISPEAPIVVEHNTNQHPTHPHSNALCHFFFRFRFRRNGSQCLYYMHMIPPLLCLCPLPETHAYLIAKTPPPPSHVARGGDSVVRGATAAHSAPDGSIGERSNSSHQWGAGPNTWVTVPLDGFDSSTRKLDGFHHGRFGVFGGAAATGVVGANSHESAEGAPKGRIQAPLADRDEAPRRIDASTAGVACPGGTNTAKVSSKRPAPRMRTSMGLVSQTKQQPQQDCEKRID